MSLKETSQQRGGRSQRWISALTALAHARGNSEAVATRAVELVRQLNVSPWVGLAVAERLISLKDAQRLDRVGRCKELQAAILDKHKALDDLTVLMPYASHFLALDLAEAQPGRKWDERVVIRILDGVLGQEMKTEGDALSLRVRTRPLKEYGAIVDRVLAIMKRTRCDAGMALDVEAGRVTEQFAADYIRQKRALEMEERRLMAPPLVDERSRFPPRRDFGEGRRTVYHRSDAPRQDSGFARDHWPK